ncbi:MAG: argininosuccinate synthase, partial [Clostridium sp.]|nr:argininosuccinate synthase [Clostridium sp.]
FTTGDLYDHHDADGFITLFGLPLKVRAMKMAEIEQAKKSGKNIDASYVG